MRDGLPDEKIEHLRKLCRGNESSVKNLKAIEWAG